MNLFVISNILLLSSCLTVQLYCKERPWCTLGKDGPHCRCCTTVSLSHRLDKKQNYFRARQYKSMKTFLQTFIVLSSFRKVLRASLAQSLYTTTQQSHTLNLPSNICFNKMVHTKCRGEFYHHRTDDGTFGKVKLIKIVILTIWL